MADSYRSALRSVVRGLWSGAVDDFQAFEVFQAAVEQAFRRAWRQGAAECGIAESEYTDDERLALDNAIRDELKFIDGFLDAIMENDREADGKLDPLYIRAELWVKRFVDVENRAKAMACKDKKLKWVMDPAKENCCSCQRLSNKVKRASFWNEKGVRPQHPSLHCMASAGGPSVCGCRFKVTDEPLSRGPLPNWRC